MTSEASTGGGLAGSASRGAAVTLTGQALRMIVQLAGIVVLARLLSPQDYGLVAMVTAIIGLAEVLRDFGLSSAAIQAEDLSKKQSDNLFWINTCVGAVLMGLVCLAAGPIADLYGDPRLEPLTYALSVTFLLNGIATQYRAHLIRDLHFTRLYTSELAGQFLALALAVGFAWSGSGYWALAIQQVGQALLVSVALMLLTRWRPGGVHRGVPMRQFISYAFGVTGAQLLSYASRNVDSFIIGHRFGAEPLGYYNRAFQLVALPLIQLQAPATRVALPVLSRLQNTRDRFNEFHRLGQNALLTLVALLFGLFGAQAAAVVELALGRTWLPAVPILEILLVSGLFQAAGYSTYWGFLAKGKTRANFIYALVTRPAMIGLIAVGSIWGVYGVAVAYAVSMAIIWPVGVFWLATVSDIDARSLLGTGLRTMVVYGSATLVSWLSTAGWLDGQPLLHLLVGWPVFIATVGLWLAVWPGFRRETVTLADARKHLRRRAGSASASGGAADGAGVGEVTAVAVAESADAGDTLSGESVAVDDLPFEAHAARVTSGADDPARRKGGTDS